MDPDETLDFLRIGIRRLKDEAGDRNWVDVDLLVEHFEALDEWLSKGGFRPRAWRATDPKTILERAANEAGLR